MLYSAVLRTEQAALNQMAAMQQAFPPSYDLEMQEAGRKLRRARERLRLKYRDVEEASQRIANSRGSQEFSIGLSRLADIENKGTVPSIYRLYSLCAIYGLDLSTVLGWYGVELAHLPGDSATLSLPQTRPVDFRIPERAWVELPCELDLELDMQRTSYLSRHIQRWGKLPLMLLGTTELRNQRYGLIGSEDWSMHPLIAPGAVVQIDESKRRITNDGWIHEFERPIYFLEDRTGYKCRWCTEKSGFLIAQPHSTSQVPLEVFRFPGEIDVIGQVVGVAMRLDQVRRRHIRS